MKTNFNFSVEAIANVYNEKFIAKTWNEISWLNDDCRENSINYFDDAVEMLTDDDPNYCIGNCMADRVSWIDKFAKVNGIEISMEDIEKLVVLSYMVGEFDVPDTDNDTRAKYIGADIPDSWWLIYNELERDNNLKEPFKIFN